MNEPQKTDDSIPPAGPILNPPIGPHLGIQLTRLFFGLLWILATFALIAIAGYLAWPWIMTKVTQFYN